MIFACAVAATVPLAWKGNSCGHDFDFHLQSWMAVAQQWRHGVIDPHWIEGANYGAGEPRLVFYPPFSWMLGALLGSILPWNVAPVAFTLVVLTACGFSMDRLASEWLPANAAALAACAYILNPYALFVAYERTAYGELAAGIWLPLIILYALKGARSQGVLVAFAVREKPNPANEGGTNCDMPRRSACRGPRSAMTQLALAIAAIWLTNAPAAVMASYTVAVATLWIAMERREWRPILPVAAGLILGLGLAAIYIVPAAFERRWVDIARAIDPGMRIADSFLFEHTGEPYHDQVLRTASWIFAVLLAAIAVSSGIAWKRRSPRSLLVPLLAVAAVLFALQLPWSRFVWNHAPELRFLQFPWRWSLVLSIVLSISLGLALKIPTGNQLKKSFALQITLILGAAIALASVGTHLFWQLCDEEDAVSAQLAVFRAGSGFEGTDEYTPFGRDNSLIQQGLPAVRALKNADAETANPVDSDNSEQQNPAYVASPQDQLPALIKAQIWQPESKAFTVTTQSPAYAVLRLMDYPAWRVKVDGAEIRQRPHREDGLMAIPIHSGSTHLEVAYAATRDVLWGRSLSFVSLLVLLALGAARRKRRALGYYD